VLVRSAGGVYTVRTDGSDAAAPALLVPTDELSDPWRVQRSPDGAWALLDIDLSTVLVRLDGSTPALRLSEASPGGSIGTALFTPDSRVLFVKRAGELNRLELLDPVRGQVAARYDIERLGAFADLAGVAPDGGAAVIRTEGALRRLHVVSLEIPPRIIDLPAPDDADQLFVGFAP
jgi:streptogramin lyase